MLALRPLPQVPAALMTRRRSQTLPWLARQVLIVDLGPTTFSLAFNHDKFNTCFTGKLSISSGCSECYATNGEFAAKNCKAACLLGWCKQGCLDCSTADEPKSALDACTGFTSGSADPCLETTAAGACGADDQAALADSATVGKAGSDCGLGAYNVLTGIQPRQVQHLLHWQVEYLIRLLRVLC